MRLVIVPRWSGDQSSDFYPWLLSRCADQFDSIAVCPLLPTASSPTIRDSVAGLREMLGSSTHPTLLLGHSVGNQVILRALAESPPGTAIGCLLVAFWFQIDEPWPDILPWTEDDVPLARCKSAAGPISVLLSDNDPFTRNAPAQGGRLRAELGATIRIESGAKHFNASPQPVVLEELQALLARVTA